MNLYRFYLLVVGLSPFIFVAIVWSDFWGVVGFGYKLSRANKRLSAKFYAWLHTRKHFNNVWKLVWEDFLKNDKRPDRRRQSYRHLKKRTWDYLYQKTFEGYLSDFEKDKHIMEIEYEDRLRRGL